MTRSPFLILAFSVFSAALVWPQTNSPEPQPASGAPKAPLSGTQATGPAATGTQPSTTAQPSATQPSTPQLPASQQPSPTQQPAAPVNPSTTVQEELVEPPPPKTEILDSSATSSAFTTDGHDPVLDPPPIPDGKTTLVGGTVTGVDHIRNHMTVAVFRGSHWKIAFDERTHIFRNGAETTQLAIKKGERVYVDTMLDSARHEVFARNIRLGIAAPAADADGQITDVNPEHGTVQMRDQINSEPVHFTVDNNTKIVYGSRMESLGDLKPGTLVHVRFSPGQSNRGLAREISIIAAPGAAFTYVGKITYLDMHRGTLAMQNSLDDKNYEIHFNPAHVDIKDSLAVGSEVRIVAVFEGERYTAQSITLTKSAAAAEKE
jgi:Domain of unknown function (DUF5666)